MTYSTRLPIFTLLAGLAALLATHATAQTAPQAPEMSASPAPKPLWEVGGAVFAASQPAYPGAATRTSRALALPFVIYRGEFLRAEQNNVGLRAIKTPRFELDVGFAGSLGSNSKDVPARLGMQDLGSLIEFGPRLKINIGEVTNGRSSLWVELPVRGVFDLSNSFANRGVNNFYARRQSLSAATCRLDRVGQRRCRSKCEDLQKCFHSVSLRSRKS